VGFKPAIPAKERPQTHALDRAATGTGANWLILTDHLLTVTNNSHKTTRGTNYREKTRLQITHNVARKDNGKTIKQHEMKITEDEILYDLNEAELCNKITRLKMMQT
jgi:hypothetical protein